MVRSILSLGRITKFKMLTDYILCFFSLCQENLEYMYNKIVIATIYDSSPKFER
jgi:hypothetical protein